jgi:hypothetical protein
MPCSPTACDLLPIKSMYLALERLWRVLPVPVLVLDRMPGRLVGLSMGVFIVLRRDYAADRPTVVHELEHCKQFWRGGVMLHMLRYYVSRDYRLRMEVEAFRAELAACDAAARAPRLDDAARALATGYHIGLDVPACRNLLSCSHPFAVSSPTSPVAGAPLRTSSPPVTARSTDSTRR